jgi:hypothetical protein
MSEEDAGLLESNTQAFIAKMTQIYAMAEPIETLTVEDAPTPDAENIPFNEQRLAQWRDEAYKQAYSTFQARRGVSPDLPGFVGLVRMDATELLRDRLKTAGQNPKLAETAPATPRRPNRRRFPPF